MDSLVAVETLRADTITDGRHSLLIRSIQEWHNKDWEIRIYHVFREANQVTDLLAHLGHILPLGTHLNCTISQDIERYILSNYIGVAFSRVCSLFN
ncbi:hypothetical protein LINPERPRIM_LOCUS20639 [Linum perenne]